MTSRLRGREGLLRQVQRPALAADREPLAARAAPSLAVPRSARSASSRAQSARYEFRAEYRSRSHARKRSRNPIGSDSDRLSATKASQFAASRS